MEHLIRKYHCREGRHKLTYSWKPICEHSIWQERSHRGLYLEKETFLQWNKKLEDKCWHRTTNHELPSHKYFSNSSEAATQDQITQRLLHFSSTHLSSNLRSNLRQKSVSARAARSFLNENHDLKACNFQIASAAVISIKDHQIC